MRLPLAAAIRACSLLVMGVAWLSLSGSAHAGFIVVSDSAQTATVSIAAPDTFKDSGALPGSAWQVLVRVAAFAVRGTQLSSPVPTSTGTMGGAGSVGSGNGPAVNAILSNPAGDPSLTSAFAVLDSPSLRILPPFLSGLLRPPRSAL